MKSSFPPKIASASYMFILSFNQAPEEMIVGGMPKLYQFEYYCPSERIPAVNATANMETEDFGENSTTDTLKIYLFNNCKWFSDKSPRHSVILRINRNLSGNHAFTQKWAELQRSISRNDTLCQQAGSLLTELLLQQYFIMPIAKEVSWTHYWNSWFPGRTCTLHSDSRCHASRHSKQTILYLQLFR